THPRSASTNHWARSRRTNGRPTDSTDTHWQSSRTRHSPETRPVPTNPTAGAARCREPVPSGSEGPSVVPAHGVFGFAVDFFAAVDSDDAVLDDVDFAVDFFAAVVFDAVDFFAVVFFAGALRVVFFFAGPFARFSASRVAARSSVTASTESSLRRVALVSPSVT